MSYDINCHSCPYFQQKHLPITQHTSRISPPIELEAHGSSTLLIFQAPGDIEWAVGQAIQPTTKIGGTAGVRIRNSWVRRGKIREDFDITNAVQCFPGNGGARDIKPTDAAISFCAERLMKALEEGHYSNVIAFGDVAHDVATRLTKNIGSRPPVTYCPHPNGGVSNSKLDSLW